MNEKPISLEKTVWQLVSFHAPTETKKIPADPAIFIKFENGGLAGFGGCNTLGGKYSAEGDKLQIEGVFSTKKFCQNTMETERKLVDLLGQSRTWLITGDRLEIYCGDAGHVAFKANFGNPGGN